MTTRALFSLSEKTLERLRELVPARQRSALVESLLSQELTKRESARESALEGVTHLVETHPDFSDTRLASNMIDAIAGENAE